MQDAGYNATTKLDRKYVRGPLAVSIKANRDELIAFLNEWADGVWSPAPRSGLREAQQILGCGLGAALDAVEAALKEHAA